MKKLIVALFLLIAVTANAAPKGQDWNDPTGIIKPNEATGASRYGNFTFDQNGNVLVCPGNASYSYDNTCIYNGHNSWKTLWSAVPAGRQYVGFKLVSGYQGSSYYEVYWK